MEENNNLIVELDKAKEDTLYDEDKGLKVDEVTETLDVVPTPVKPKKAKKLLKK